ncbi:MAG: hypothetical protein FWD33_00440 [Alphaproteobacteria bacterium]|nr:hypothetical protein [Alphaproteobacteria bacterium]
MPDKSYSEIRELLASATVDYTTKFSITRSCNLACAHCGENSGPGVKNKLIPKEDVIFYMDELRHNPRFKCGGFLISGGEATLAYDIDPNYLSDICLAGIKRNSLMILKTNGWIAKAGAKYYDRFIADLELLATKSSDLFKLHLSMDQWHDNFSENIQIMTELYTNPKLRNISSEVMIQTAWFNENMDRILATGLPYEKKLKISEYVGRTRLDRWSGHLINIGRAKKLDWPHKHDLDWKDELDHIEEKGESRFLGYNFTSNGKLALTLGMDNSIAVNYRNKKGRFIPAGQLRDELLDLAAQKISEKMR